MVTPSRRSPSTIPRRAAHCEQTVIVPARQHRGHQLVQRRGEVEVELLGPTRYAEPRGLAGQPQRDLGAGRGRGGGDGEALVAALGVLGAAGDLDDE